MRLLCSSFFLLIGTVVVHAAVTIPNFMEGKTAFVHLFEWKWPDVAKECERFLGPHGYAGVQVSPPMEHRIYPEQNYPWWQRYQPVSYQIESRSGSREEFADMVERCNAVGVRVYVDAIVNHMAAITTLDNSTYTFPGVPYDVDDFNVPRGLCPNEMGEINQYSYINSSDEVRFCNLLSLADLYYGEGNDYKARTMVVAYLNDLISMGVAGFRIDAAKHMVPEDLVEIAERLDECTFEGNPDPWIYNEVIDRTGGEAIKPTEYFASGDVTEFKYCDHMAELGRGTRAASEFQDIGTDDKWSLMPTENAVVFVENHDNQRNHGGGGDILAFQEPLPYKKAVSFTLAWPYGTTRLMSSYAFDNTDQGPPSDENGVIDDVIINSRGMCDGGWVCEHRWHEIRNMVCFRNLVGDEPVENWWDNGGNFIAFSRGDKGFYALNNEKITVTQVLQTGLPEGTYCDIISGDPTSEGCSGQSVEVLEDGTAEITLEPSHVDYDGIIALTYQATSGKGNYEGCLYIDGAASRLVANLPWISLILALLFFN